MSNIAFSLGEHVELPGDIDHINSEDMVEVIDLAYANGIVDGKILLAKELLQKLGL
jgi:hypothetical protein